MGISGIKALPLAPISNLRQTHFRFRSDAGTVDAAPTWSANEDVVFNPVANIFRLRIGVLNTGDPAGPVGWQIMFSKNGGAYQSITTATVGVKAVDAGASADDAAIATQRLSL